MSNPTPRRAVLSDGTPLVRPSRKIAQRIYKHVSHYADDRDDWLLAIHCTAGVSRSGAVAMWAWETFKPTRQTWTDFLDTHFHTLPNQSLLRLLKEVSHHMKTGERR